MPLWILNTARVCAPIASSIIQVFTALMMKFISCSEILNNFRNSVIHVCENGYNFTPCLSLFVLIICFTSSFVHTFYSSICVVRIFFIIDKHVIGQYLLEIVPYSFFFWVRSVFPFNIYTGILACGMNLHSYSSSLS